MTGEWVKYSAKISCVSQTKKEAMSILFHCISQRHSNNIVASHQRHISLLPSNEATEELLVSFSVNLKMKQILFIVRLTET